MASSGTGAVSLIDSIEAAAVSEQPYLLDALGQVFYPDGPEDAACFIVEHGAWWVGVPPWDTYAAVAPVPTETETPE